MTKCERKQIYSDDRTDLEQDLDLMDEKGWKLESLKLVPDERGGSQQNKKNEGKVLFVADLVRFPS